MGKVNPLYKGHFTHIKSKSRRSLGTALFLWCRSETMDNLFKNQVCFNDGNPYLFKVRDDATLKDMKDQLNEVTQGLNPGDTRRVKDVQYRRPGLLQFDKIMLTDDDCMRSMFFVFRQYRMFPRIDYETRLCLGSIIIM